MEHDNKQHYLFSNKAIFHLIIPLMIEQLLAVLVGMIDSIMVAKVGEAAVSAVSLVDSVNILLLNVFAALATGGAVIAGQYIGQREYKKACNSSEQLILFCGIISIFIMILAYIGRYFILDVVFGDIAPDVYNYSLRFMNIILVSIPFIAIYNCGTALFRVMGNAKITMQISLIMNIINAVGIYISINILHMGIEGAAISTLLARIIACVFIILPLRNESLPVHISKKPNFKINKNTILRILNIGIPNGIENSMFQLGKILLLSIVASFGTSSITANAIGNTLSTFQSLSATSLGLAMITVVSQCVGANDYEQVKYYTKKLIKYAYISLIIINVFIFALLPLILNIYNLSYETESLTMKLLISYGILTCIMWPTSFTLPNALRAANDVKYTMIIGVGSMWIFRIGFGILFAKYLGFGMFGVWIAMYLDWFVRSVSFSIRYLGGKWKDKRYISQSEDI